jgi:hypothetical protein
MPKTIAHRIKRWITASFVGASLLFPQFKINLKFSFSLKPTIQIIFGHFVYKLW